MKSTNRILILTSFFFTLSCGKDESQELIAPYFFQRDCKVTSPTAALGFSNGCYTLLLEDNFLDNSNNWNLQTNSKFIHNINDGYLKLSTNKNESLIWGVLKEIQGLIVIENFEYEVRFRIASVQNGSEQRYCSISWGVDDNIENYQSFRFNSKNEFIFFQRQNATNNTIHYSGILSIGSFLSNSFTTLTVRSYNGICYLFINQRLVHQMPAKNLFGNNIYLGASGGNEVWIDKVKVSKIN